MNDLISRQAAIEALTRFITPHDNGDGTMTVGVLSKSSITDILNDLPSAQPERLTDDDFETIRIHLNAYKEKLCNQQRWEEADEYQRILDRFMAFASAQAQPDLSEYSDKLWRNAYERGKAEAQRTGRWIDHVEDGYVECPFCHSATNCDDNISELHFCFSCGARMEGGNDDERKSD